MEADNQKEEQPITVATYRPAQFAAADWEVVSDDSKQEAFCAEVFESVALNQHVVDPMFADFTNDLVRVEETKVAEQPEFKAEHVQTPAEPQTSATHSAAPDLEQLQTQPFKNSELDSELSSGALKEQPQIDNPVEQHVELNLSEHSTPSQQELSELAATSSEQLQEVEQFKEPQSADTTEQLEPAEQLEPNEQLETNEQLAVETANTPVQQHESEVFSVMDQALRAEYERGLASAREQLDLLQKQYEERYTVIYEDMQTQLDEALASYERQAVDLAFQVAKRLVGDAVSTKRDYIVPIIQEAIKAAGGARVKSVKVSPSDYEFLSLGSYGDIIKSGSETKIVFEADQSIRSGCVVCTTAGEIDCDLDKAWARLRDKTLEGAK